jgi:DEAD/DEAH box helicase domain-containing protein
MAQLTDKNDEIEPEATFEPIEPDEEKSPRILYFDLETRNLAAEVGGWKNCHLMRVSVASVYDTRYEEFLTFTEERLEEFFGLLTEADLVVGFNIKRFDFLVLRPYTTMALERLPAFDILEDINRRLGFRLGLDHLAQQTLGRGKSADGLQAVSWFRSGEMEKLAEYCRRDVEVTRDLFLYGIEHGHLIYRRKGVDVPVRLPVDWDIEKIIMNTVPEKVPGPEKPYLFAGRRK